MRHFIVMSTLLVLPSMALGKQPAGRKVFPAEIPAGDLRATVARLRLPLESLMPPPTVLRYRLDDSTSHRLGRIVIDPQTPVR
jgi:hypothetical protein